MKLTELRPILWSDKLEETIVFYTDVLGFSVAEYHEDWGWASLYNGDAHLMFARPNAHTAFEKPLFTGSFYINTDEVDVLWETLKDKANIAYDIENFEWGMREFAIYDNNGYMLQFGQEI